MSWQDLLLTDPGQLRELLHVTRRVAVLGIKTEAQAEQPAFYVAQYLVRAGLDVVPVPVYYPEVTHILGQPVFRRLADIPGELDLVNVFRRPADVPAHLDDLLAKRPRAVWLQTGIRHDGAAETLARAGIPVVQDRCLMVEHRRLLNGHHAPMNPERDLGEQPIARLLVELGLKASDLVAASGEHLTHKMVARAAKGRRLTPNVQGKVLRAMNRATGKVFTTSDLFLY